MQISFLKSGDGIGSIKSNLVEQAWIPLRINHVSDINFYVKSVVAKYLYLFGLINAKSCKTRVWDTNMQVLRRLTGQKTEVIEKALEELVSVGLIKIETEDFSERGMERKIERDINIVKSKIDSTANVKNKHKDFIELYNKHTEFDKKKKFVLSTPQKRKVDEIVKNYTTEEIVETIKKMSTVDDSNWSSGKVCFAWLLRSSHFDDLFNDTGKKNTDRSKSEDSDPRMRML